MVSISRVISAPGRRAATAARCGPYNAPAGFPVPPPETGGWGRRSEELRAAALALSLVLAEIAQPMAQATGDVPEQPGRRCSDLIALFDRIVQSRFDHRLLAIEKRQLDEARELRLRADVDCASGEKWFGLQRIEDALMLIGAPTLPEPEVPRTDDSRQDPR